MKKTILFTIGMFIVFGIAWTFAQGILSPNNLSVVLSDNAETGLESRGVTSPEISELKCDSKECEFRMYDGDFNLGTHIIPRRNCTEINVSLEDCKIWENYTNEQLINLVENKTAEALEFYGNVFKARNEREEKESLLGSGEITINNESVKFSWLE